MRQFYQNLVQIQPTMNIFRSLEIKTDIAFIFVFVDF